VAGAASTTAVVATIATNWRLISGAKFGWTGPRSFVFFSGVLGSLRGRRSFQQT
jgi:hypothetical protein